MAAPGIQLILLEIILNKWYKIQLAENAYSWSYIDEKLKFEFDILFAAEGFVEINSWHPASNDSFYQKFFEINPCDIKKFEKNSLDKLKVLLFNETIKKLNKVLKDLI